MIFHTVEIILLVLILALALYRLIRSEQHYKSFQSELVVPQEEEKCCDCNCSNSEPEKSRYYAVCVCTKTKNGQRVYRSFTTENLIEGRPSANDLERLRQNVLAANVEYKDCVITFFDKIKD